MTSSVAEILAKTEGCRYELHVTIVPRPSFLVMEARALKVVQLSKHGSVVTSG